MNQDIESYNNSKEPNDANICNELARIINMRFDGKIDGVTSKKWHGHPVWFINDNPIVGYSKEKRGIRLMFWSGKDFKEDGLNIVGEKFKDASIFYNAISQIEESLINIWLDKSVLIQWDYKNIVKRKGLLVRL